MNTETQFLVKIFPIRNCLISMMKCDEIQEALPTVLFMFEEVKTVIKIIKKRAKNDRQAKSWARNADVVLNSVYDLQKEIKKEVAITGKNSPYIQKKPGLWYATVCSILLADMHKTKLGKKILGDLLESSYGIEDIAGAGVKNQDQIFDEAHMFVERIYSTIEGV